MSINLTPDQEQFIQTKLQSGKYSSAEELLEVALRLLDEYDAFSTRERDRADAEWVEEVREKIDAALNTSEPSVNGETFVSGVLERFHRLRQSDDLKPVSV